MGVSDQRGYTPDGGQKKAPQGGDSYSETWVPQNEPWEALRKGHFEVERTAGDSIMALLTF